MPLADTIRPTSLDDFVGQQHLVSPGKPIYELLRKKMPMPIIFWGPPGVGKTTLARIIANELEADFVELSAVSAGKNDVRQVVKESQEKQLSFDSQSLITILFLDEIHRFNKAQQDFLLPYVEDGTLTLIGATTENPSFSVIAPLLSRSQVFVLESLSDEDIHTILSQAATQLSLKATKGALEYLVRFADGDARKALNLLEATSKLYPKLTLKHVKQALQSKHLRYDKHGEEHHNTISAYIKSMRAGAATAAMYYLARMIEAGEDPLYIARRMVVFASEDIGLAQPTALVVANEVFRACETIGYPECAINLAHGTAYLTQAKKDRSAYDALRAAQADVKEYGNAPIPLAIRNAPTELMQDLGYGEGYEMYSEKQSEYMPDILKKRDYFN